ncbi:MAG: hypothetical protein ABMA64_32850 [Myxococcota bacterium]
MRVFVPWVGVAGCELVQELLPQLPCEDRVEVDARTGAAELSLDPSDCDRDGMVPNRVEYAQLADEAWEPLVDPDADPCNTGSSQVLVEPLAEGVLAVVPAWPEPLPADVWLEVSYWDHDSSRADWTAYFRLGHPRDVVTSEDCTREPTRR